MIATIYVFSGTGNSLWVARKLAQQFASTDIRPMLLPASQRIDSGADTIGIVFPVHMWGLPGRVLGWISRLGMEPGKYYFAVAVNAGQVAATLKQMKRAMKAHGADLSSGFSIVMPSNYIPFGGAAPKERQQALFAAASIRIRGIAAAVKEKKSLPVEKGPIWQNILFSGLHRLAAPHVEKTDKKFWVDDKCDSCRLCERICPARNITMQNDRPVWQHRCEQCLACLQWCPRESIQHGSGTSRRARYHHPDIKANDLVKMVAT